MKLEYILCIGLTENSANFITVASCIYSAQYCAVYSDTRLSNNMNETFSSIVLDVCDTDRYDRHV